MPKPHSEDTKRRARQLYEQRGAAYAADQLKISVRTVRQWASEGEWARRLPVAAVAGSDSSLSRAQRIGWAIRRAGLRDHTGHVAQGILERLERQVASGKIYGVRDLALSYSVLVERAEALAGRDSGLDQPDLPAEAKRARIMELVDVVEQRKASNDGG
jgi:hypothetical protein